MKLSNKARYAVRAVFDIAYHGRGEPTQVKAISSRQAIPPRFLEQIFQDLKKADLVRSRRGPRGGYALTRSPELVSVADVVHAVEGPTDLRSSDHAALEGDAESRAISEAAFVALGHQIDGILAEVTFESLCRDAQAHEVRRGANRRYVYSI